MYGACNSTFIFATLSGALVKRSNIINFLRKLGDLRWRPINCALELQLSSIFQCQISCNAQSPMAGNSLVSGLIMTKLKLVLDLMPTLVISKFHEVRIKRAINGPILPKIKRFADFMAVMIICQFHEVTIKTKSAMSGTRSFWGFLIKIWPNLN